MKNSGNKFFFFSGGLIILGGGLLLTIIFLLNPYKDLPLAGDLSKEVSNIFSLLLFYGSTLVFISGVFSTLFFWRSKKKNRTGDLYLQAVTSFRRSILMGVLVCLLLLLQSWRMLVWWDALLVAVAVILLEAYLAVRNG
jgi:membrane glycosyltransferase